MNQPSAEPVDYVAPSPSLLRRLLARRCARRQEGSRQANVQLRAWHVQDILVGCGLGQVGYSIGGGRVVHIPQVVSVDAGPPETLDIRPLLGQMPDDFTARAPAIAYDLGMAEVRVVPLGLRLIRLELLPGADQTQCR